MSSSWDGQSSCREEFCCSVTLFFALLICVLFGCIVLPIVYMNEHMNSGGTTEQCVIVDYDASNCTYSCECVDYQYGGTSCNECDGTHYDYVVIAPSKCNDTELYRDYTDLGRDCPATLKDIGYEMQCTVFDCDEERFSLDIPNYASTEDWKIAGWVVFAVGAVPCFALCCWFGHIERAR